MTGCRHIANHGSAATIHLNKTWTDESDCYIHIFQGPLLQSGLPRRAVALSVPVIVPALWLMTESSFGLLVTLGIVCAA